MKKQWEETNWDIRVTFDTFSSIGFPYKGSEKTATATATFIPFNDIMTQIDDCEDLDEFIELTRYMQKYKKDYPLIQVQFAGEFMKEKHRKLISEL